MKPRSPFSNTRLDDLPNHPPRDSPRAMKTTPVTTFHPTTNPTRRNRRKTIQKQKTTPIDGSDSNSNTFMMTPTCIDVCT